MNENIHEKYVYICTNIPLGKNIPRSNILANSRFRDFVEHL